MLRFGIPLLVAAAAVLSGPAAADTPPLQASVGPGFTISLRDATGSGVSHLDPGTYTIHVDDQSDLHNFHLTGPGVNKSTEVAATGAEDWQVTLADGTYKYVCDVHATTMRGTFTVGTVSLPPVTLKLAGTVGPRAKISLAHTAKAGKTVLTIRDRSTKDNFHLTGPALNKKTGVKFTGTVKWTVTLKAGTYTFRSDAHASLKGTLKVSPAAA
jgi:plastocyanin